MPPETLGDAARRLGAGTDPAGPNSADGIYTLSPEEMRVYQMRHGPDPLPRPASPQQIEELRQRLRECQHQHHQETKRLDALRTALARARDEHGTAWRVVDETESAVKNARLYSRKHLVAAYIDGQPTEGWSVVHAEAEAKLAADHLASAKELVQALEQEIAGAQSTVREAARQVDEATTAVICASPEFLLLLRRQRSQWAKIRSLRLTILAVARELGTGLTGRLLEQAQASEPLDREVGWKIDERLIATWTEAVAQLRANADAQLPSANGSGRD